MLFQTGYLAGIFSKWTKGACHFKEKQLIVFIANDKIWASKQKLESWKLVSTTVELDSIPELKDFSKEIYGDINECDFFFFWIVYNEMGQHLEYLYNSTKQYFPMTNAWYYKIVHG